MKTVFLFLVASMFTYCLPAATLDWVPSAPGGVAVAKYRVYSSPVVAPANATWTVYGETNGLTLLITNNVYRMFQVVAVSAPGTESDPSNVVTNILAKPNPPGPSTINAAIEGAPSINGPWQELTNATVTVAVNQSTNQFFRAKTTIVMR
jgi:hypothetical protein